MPALIYIRLVTRIDTNSCLTESNSIRVEHSRSSIVCMSLSWAEDSSRIFRSFSTDSWSAHTKVYNTEIHIQMGKNSDSGSLFHSWNMTCGTILKTTTGCPADLNEAKAGIRRDRWSCNSEARAKPWQKARFQCVNPWIMSPWRRTRTENLLEHTVEQSARAEWD